MEPLKCLVLPELHPGKIRMPSEVPRVPQQRPNSLRLTSFNNLVAKRMQEVILQLRTKVVGKLATRVDSEGCGQWSSENCDELVPVLRVHYPLLFVVEIESGVLSGEGSPRGIVFVGRRIGIRFGTLPHVISALPEVLSLSSGSASSPPTTHCCRR